MQSRRHSLLEACLNTLSGFVIAVLLQLAVNKYHNLPLTFGQSVGVTLIFTVASVVRSYIWRRIFNKRTYETTKDLG